MGRVLAPYGVRGWIKVAPYTDSPQALLGYTAWRMSMRGEHEPREFRVAEGRVHGRGAIARVEGVDTREAAALLRGSTIAVQREALPEPQADEVYLADLAGCAVVNRAGVALGTVQGVDDFGAHPILRVARREGEAERLIPLVDAYVANVDLGARVIEVDWEEDY